MKIMESGQWNGEETTRNPWCMETNLQYIDKQLGHRVISKDDSLLQPWCTHMQTHTHTNAHHGFCKDSKENICVLKVLTVIFSYFFPLAVIIFSHVKQIKTPRPNGGWRSSSHFPLSGSQTRCSYKQVLCRLTWPTCVSGCVQRGCVGMFVCVQWLCVNFQVSANTTVHSGWAVLVFLNIVLGPNDSSGLVF